MGLRLLFLCDEYPPGKHGGIGTAVQSLGRTLVQMGHDVTVAGLYDPSYGGDAFFADQGVHVHRFYRDVIRRGRKPLLVRAARKVARRLRLPSGDPHPDLRAYQRSVCELIRRNRIQLVVTPDFSEHVTRCASYRHPARWPVPTVAVIHGGFTYLHRQAGIAVPEHWYRMERDLLLQATTVAAVSRFAARTTAANFNLDRPITVLHNGIAIREHYPPAARDDLQAIYVGALWESKGVFQLAKAWNKVHASLPSARLLILGKGPTDPVQAHLATEARQSVHFLGHVDRDTVYQHLSESAVAALPSYGETFGLTALEAMQSGVATIFTARTSGPELIEDGQDGLLIDPDDVGGLAAAMIRLLSDHGARDQLSRNGRAKVIRDFDIGNVAGKYVDFFESTLDQRHKPVHRGGRAA